MISEFACIRLGEVFFPDKSCDLFSRYTPDCSINLEQSYLHRYSMNFDLSTILAANCFLLAKIHDVLKFSLASDHFY